MVQLENVPDPTVLAMLATMTPVAELYELTTPTM